jgi:erythromycin esterase-like protein
MEESLQPYPLPVSVIGQLMDLAATTEFLLLGEGAHGTQEVPRLVAGLLDDLDWLGYGALALEVPIDSQEECYRYAHGLTNEPPRFFTDPSPDGRGSIQLLALIRLVAAKGWQVLCMDMGDHQPGPVWKERDAWMARNLLAQRQAYCPGRKVLVVAGHMHTRLTDLPAWAEVPFLAANLRQWQEGQVSSIALVHHRGTFYFNGLQRIEPEFPPLTNGPEVRPSNLGHTIDLHLPEATAATYLRPPGR